MTFDCAADVVCEVSFTGSGAIVKRGDGALSLKGESAYSGGTFVEAGKLVLYPSTAAGTGKITVDRSVEGVNSIAYFYGTNSVNGGKTIYANDIHVKGTHVDVAIPGVQNEAKAVAAKGPLQSYYDVQFDGKVTADGSVMYYNEHTRDVTFNNTVTVPEGETIALDGHNGNACFFFKKEALGSITKFSTGRAWNTLKLYVPCGRATETLTVHEGSAYLESSGSWRGSRVVITNLPFAQYRPGLANTSKKSFRSDFALYLATGCTFALQVCGQTASHLYYNGVEQANGVYTPGMLDGAFTGSQDLTVGRSLSVWVGGRSGKWSVASNWDPAVVPGAGSVVSFTNVVYTEKETVDIGSDGIVISSTVNYSNSRNQANISNDFIGVGSVTKVGPGDVTLLGTSTYTGATRVYNGLLRADGTNAILPNPVTVYSISGGNAGFGTALDRDLLNDINIVGTAGSPHAVSSNCTRMMGRITSEDDFELDNSWGGGMWRQTRVLGGISAHGKTVTVAGWDYATSTSFESDIDASVTKNSCSAPFFIKSGTTGYPDAKLTIQGGTNYILAAATIAMTNIVLVKKDKCCAISIESGKSIDRETTLDAGAGTFVILPEKTSRVRVAHLVVGGETKRNGNYRAADNPTWMGGKGVLCVGPVPGQVILMR